MEDVTAKAQAGFKVEEIEVIPKTPQTKEAVTIKGKVKLFGLSYLAPCWIIATITYPKEWWEILGAKEEREMEMAIGGAFEVKYSKGFEKDGEYGLAVRLYAGPSIPVDSLVLPPLPAVATEEITFEIVKAPPPLAVESLVLS